MEIINIFSKVAGYKINAHESPAFKITLDNIKYLGIFLPRHTQELYEHNYKILYTQLKQDLNNWKNINCSWV